MDSMAVWYFMRSSGAVLLVLLTISLILGVFSTKGSAGSRIPRFLTQDFHRNISLLSVVMLVVHVGTAVIHSYVDIRWFDAFVPGSAVYRPVWIGLGAASLDLFAVAIVTSLIRHRINPRRWRAIHLATYAGWALAVVHGWGIGTDAGRPGCVLVQAACVLAFVSAVSVRLATRTPGREPRLATQVDAPDARFGARCGDELHRPDDPGQRRRVRRRRPRRGGARPCWHTSKTTPTSTPTASVMATSPGWR